MRTDRFRRQQIRRQPVAEVIAAAILDNAAILNLKTSRLCRDIRARYGATEQTAMAALAIARGAA